MIRRKKKLTENEFSLSPEILAGVFLADLSKVYELETDPPGYVDRTFYDSFDWRIFAAGGQLCHERHQNMRRLIWSSAQQGVPRVVMQPVARVLRFAEEFPTGAMRSVISPMLEMRALIPMVDLVTCVQLVRILDDERKTVARIQIEENRLRAKKGAEDQPVTISTRIEIFPVRGYQADLKQLREQFSKMKYLRTGMPRLLEEAMNRIGSPAGSYSAKLKFHFKPEMQANLALQQIHGFLLGVMEANIKGIRKDTDSEFLHDFRVAVRRTRSALSQIKGVFPDQQAESFNQRFAGLGQITGPTRDMHVYLLDFNKYQNSLLERFRGDLKPLKSFLKSHLAKEHKALVKHLSSAEFIDLLDQWKTFLQQEALTGEQPSEQLDQVASKRIARMVQRVMDEGHAINTISPPEDLHELRKSCKKLRYLMEFFHSLYPANQINDLIKELKVLLENLGDYQDLEVQADKLCEFSHVMAAEGKTSPDTFLAMGMLVDGLLHRQMKSREMFYDRFKNFASKENCNLFHGLFVADRRLQG